MGGKRVVFQRSARSFMSLINRQNKSSPSVGLPNPIPRPHKPFSIRLNGGYCKLPVELAGGESLMPLHTATASSLLRSMLSSKVGQWSSLSEGFATPL